MTDELPLDDPVVAEVLDGANHSSALINRRRGQVDAAARQRDNVVALATDGLITRGDLTTRIAKIEEDAVMWREELNRLVQAADWRAQVEEVTSLLEEFCKDIRPTLDVMTDEERRELLLTVVDKVWVAGDGAIRIEAVIDFQLVDAAVGVTTAPLGTIYC